MAESKAIKINSLTILASDSVSKSKIVDEAMVGKGAVKYELNINSYVAKGGLWCCFKSLGTRKQAQLLNWGCADGR